MTRHGLHPADLENIVSNPGHIEWRLKVTPSVEFYHDLHDSLTKRRVPMEEIGMIYKSIDPSLCQQITNKEAYSKIKDLISVYEKPSVSDEGSVAEHSESASDKVSESDKRDYHSAIRRERRAKLRIKELQKSLKVYKESNRKKEKKIDDLSAALEETRMLLHEKNSQVKHLKKTIKDLEQAVERLDIDLADNNQQTEKHETEIAELETQIHQLRQSDSEVPSLSSTTTSSQKHAYTTNVRALYYSLLSMRVPPGQIKSLVKNVISNMVPSANVDELRLPGKSCAAYMRSYEMPTISDVQKATKLTQAQQWHLNSDGTTLQQQKKVAFLINGLVCGVHNVQDGSSQVALDALKSELAKISETASEVIPKENLKLNMARIVSSTSDAAATQRKFTRLLEDYTGKEVVENTCCMHLGVNLRVAQVKAVSNLAHAQPVMDDRKSGSEDETSDLEDGNSEDEISKDGSFGDEISEDEMKLERNSNGSYHDIDLFVREIAKLFGHLGTPENADGASFRVFLAHRATECVGAEKEYYVNAQRIILERQIGSRYYVTSCNAGRIYFLSKAMVAFLMEQKMIKSLNRLESTCLKKLQDPLLLSNLQLEGLMFDKIYADLMMLVKSTDLNKSVLDMNAHCLELMEFLQILTTKPSTMLDPEVLVFSSEPRLYSDSTKLNHRLFSNYIPVRKELHQGDKSLLLSMVVAAGEAMSLKLQSYKEESLPGGQYFDPEPEVKSILSELQPHNDKTESVFGANDWLNTILPNMAQSTRSTMLEFSYNKTMEWLKLQSKEQTQALITLAQERRQIVQKQTKEEQQHVFKKKLEQRTKILEKARNRKLLLQHKIDDLKSETLISSEEELSLRVKNLSSLSIPQALKDAELKKMIQRQVQLRTTVFKQKGLRINLTERGKPRSLTAILAELKAIIINRPVRVRRVQAEVGHQQLYVIFNKPSLLIGSKIKHRFEEGGSLKWYEGIITSVRGRKLHVYYQETNEKCQFSLEEIKEDFYSGDFYIV